MITTAKRLGWLTQRERIVLVHLVEGLNVDQIAAAEFVSVATVRTQVRSILCKLGVHTQLAAVALVNRHLWADENERQEALKSLV